jgi:hypothetical protein
MTRIIVNSLLFSLCIDLCATIYADVAPPVYPGYSLSPFDDKGVRMKNEEVDIYYGDTCKIEAVFEILNPAKEIVEKKIGFPLNVSFLKPRGRKSGDTASKIYDFALSLNGQTLTETDVPNDPALRYDTHYWYGWTCRFKPDLNTVKLTYHTLTSYGGSGYRWEKTVHYILNSDKHWPEKIEKVRVTVHFPGGISKRQILAETSPQGYEINDREVAWRFTSLSPRPECNIVLHIIDFKFFAKVLTYEKILSAPGADNATKLNAATFFASLAPSRGINISAPTYFKRSYYDGVVLPNLTSAERILFNSAYKLNKGNGFEDYYTWDNYEQYKTNDALRRTVTEVMNRVGYFEKIEYPVIYKYIEWSKKLFREVVANDPRNAAAWKAYIDNYYLIETGGCSPCLPWAAQADCPESQKELVREAFRNCGNDSIIALWNSFLFPVQSPLPDTIELVRHAKAQKEVTIKIQRSRHGWSERPLSSPELGLFKKAYTLSGDSLFVLRSTDEDRVTNKKLIEILGGSSLYHFKFCEELAKLRPRGK